MNIVLARGALALLLGGLSVGLSAQTSGSAAEPTQLVTLSASAYREVAQDWLTVVVRTRLEGNEPMAVQKQLKDVVDQALSQLRPQTQAKLLEVHTGSFGIFPRHNEKGRMVGWTGHADLVIEGRDFTRIASAASQVPRMAVESAQFSVSREARQALETDVQSQAVQSFRQKAQQLAQDFGFAGYTLRQVTVGAVDRPVPIMAMARMAPAMAAEATPSPIPLEAGKDEVRITVSGSVQLR